MTAPFVRSPYNYDVMQASDETGLRCDDKSLTQQHFADECNINVIVDRFLKTGEMPQGVLMPSSADFDDVVDFKSAQDAIARARDNFFMMPAGLRARFQNSPQVFMEFFSDPANQDEAISLGLATRRPGSAAPAADPGPASKPVDVTPPSGV